MDATGKDKKQDKMKVAILLNVSGPEGIDIYNSFKLTEEEKKLI